MNIHISRDSQIFSSYYVESPAHQEPLDLSINLQLALRPSQKQTSLNISKEYFLLTAIIVSHKHDDIYLKAAEYVQAY